MKSYTKRITSVVLSLAIAVGATSFTKFSNVNAQETPLAPQEPSVTNTENADLEINDLAGLKKFRDTVNSGTTYEGITVVLNIDIDMSSIDNWDAIGTHTDVIGKYDEEPFKGVFKGNNHKISNLKIDKDSAFYQGLFGYIHGATIENLGVENANIKGCFCVGGLVGWNLTGRIENSYVTGSVTGTDHVGGLVGCNEGGATIENNYVTGSVIGTGYDVGGLVGWIGGLAGSNSGTIENNYAIESVTGTGLCVGALVGNNSGTVTNSYYDKDSTGQSDTGKGTPLKSTQMIGKAAQTNMIGFDFNSVWGTKIGTGLNVYYPYLKCFREDSAPYIEDVVIAEINTIEDLIEFRDNVNSLTTYEGATVNLNADIDMSTIDNWDAISGFRGTFEGKNHTISGLKINKENEDNQGLFGNIDKGAIIKNLGLKNVNVKGKGFVGGLIGSNKKGRVETSYVTGKVTGTSKYVGGLAGGNVDGTIENSYGAVEVTATGAGVGGLVGLNYAGKIKTSYGVGKVTGVGSSVGGLVGDNLAGTVTNSYYDKDTTGQSGIVIGKGTPLETAKMIGSAATTNMIGFDFSSTWVKKDNGEGKGYYPYLKNFGDISAPFIELK